MTTIKPDLPVIPFASRGAWEAWLKEHHATSDGLWLKITRKGSDLERVSVKRPLRSPVLRLDRQPGGPLRRPVLVAPIHPAPAEEQVVEG